MSFDEYLMAIGEDALLDEKLKSSLERPLLLPFHEKLLREVKNFLIMGGMPEVVAKYVETKDIKRCGPVLDDLIISLKSDFAKI